MDILRDLKRKFSRLFRERQIYHRADGVVHFITMSSKTQIVLSTIFFTFIAWVAYTTINVIFQEQIINTKDTDYRQMQTFYTTRLNETKKAYDDVISLNTFLQQHFDQTINDVTNRHKTMEQVLVGLEKSKDSKSNLIREISRGQSNGGKRNVNSIVMNTMGHEPTLRQSRIESLRKAAREEMTFTESSSLYDPSFPIKKEIFNSYSRQLELMAWTEERANKELLEVKSIINRVGRYVGSRNLGKNYFLKNKSSLGLGGPIVAINQENEMLDIFIKQAERTATVLAKLEVATKSLNYIPFGQPIISKKRRTSKFGARRDPFTKKAAMHLGIDFTSRYAAPISSTASGVVSYASPRGGFGNTVEIDHGNGLMTRYAHLSRIRVKVGQRVEINDVVGLLGSTGRSTAPHLHYEVRYHGKAINPLKFIGAGKSV